MRQLKFTAKLNTLVNGEYEIFCNGEIFCHLSESDFEIFRQGFTYPIEVL